MVRLWLFAFLWSPLAMRAALTPPPSFTFTPDLSIHELRESIRQKTIVFIGDSVTRYQYLNLAFFLERGKWPNPFFTDEVMSGSPCCEKSFPNFSWDLFFRETNKALNGNELCDCWRKDLVENRRYYHSSLDTHLIFIWYGRSPIYMRQGFTQFPFQRICNISMTSCSPNVTALYDTFTIAKIIENATLAFQPNLVVVNWGHHHTYYTNTKGGQLVYRELVPTINHLKRLSHNKTRFIFKKTTPVCTSPISDRAGHLLSCVLHDNVSPYDPQLLCSKLIHEEVFESFDTRLLIRTLAAALPLSRNALTNTTSVEQAYPLYWDSIHPHCWVMTELNRALLATYFTSSHVRWSQGAPQKKI